MLRPLRTSVSVPGIDIAATYGSITDHIKHFLSIVLKGESYKTPPSKLSSKHKKTFNFLFVKCKSIFLLVIHPGNLDYVMLPFTNYYSQTETVHGNCREEAKISCGGSDVRTLIRAANSDLENVKNKEIFF